MDLGTATHVPMALEMGASRSVVAVADSVLDEWWAFAAKFRPRKTR
jgi:hypothetical protein